MSAPGARRSVAVAALLAMVAGARAQEPGRDLPSSEHAPAREPLVLPPADRARVTDVANEIICYCGCARQTVADCDCGVADQLRRGIWSDLSSGKTPSSIVDAYVRQHGPEFRSMPVARGLGLLAWVLPWSAIALAGLAVLLVIRRWTLRPAPAPAAAQGAGTAEDPYAARVQRELEERGIR
ncbi:MAG: cytochrome c-type biogenesis protein CcmH [Acidobacteriota bacterium]